MSSSTPHHLQYKLTVALLMLATLLAATAIASADEADDAFKAGRSLLKERQPLQAYLAFEKAVSLKPDSSRYRKALEEAGQAALDEFTELRWINVQRTKRTFP